ncbi:hypothetical protein TTRE_0000437601 [Trichuris trichiura]|uniref:Uncharacterized protein n=1 Tax=Trichuris trichiura TaxID=36087 RepID=A0A077Z7C1_TRITR|nr:hypothetical protein TTRE_0000437601 [Trichuris trichiura]
MVSSVDTAVRTPKLRTLGAEQYCFERLQQYFTCLKDNFTQAFNEFRVSIMADRLLAAVSQCFSKYNCSIPKLSTLQEEGEERFIRWVLQNATVWLEISYEDGIECMRQSHAFTRHVIEKCLRQKHPGYQLPESPVSVGHFVRKMKDLGSSLALWPIAFESLKAVYHSNACSAVRTSKLNLDKCLNAAFEQNTVNPYKAMKLQEATFHKLCSIDRACLITLGENCSETVRTVLQQACQCGYEENDEIARTLEERLEQCYDITMRADVLREKIIEITDQVCLRMTLSYNLCQNGFFDESGSPAGISTDK